jgi:hypothetical protein
MNISDRIVKKRVEWITAGNKEPDTVLMPPDLYYKLITEVNSMVSFTTPLAHTGKTKFMGMDVLESHLCDGIKVGRMNP